MPPVPSAGVPARVAVPSVLSVKVTPLGRSPCSVIVKVGPLGKPVVVTEKVPELPVVNVVLSALVIAGAWSTVRVKDWVASGEVPFEAVIVKGYVPPVPSAGVPARVAVPSPLSVKVTPLGSAPGLGKGQGRLVGSPLVVTMKVPGLPVVKVVLSALVIARANREGELLGGVWARSRWPQ